MTVHCSTHGNVPECGDVENGGCTVCSHEFHVGLVGGSWFTIDLDGILATEWVPAGLLPHGRILASGDTRETAWLAYRASEAQNTPVIHNTFAEEPA